MKKIDFEKLTKKINNFNNKAITILFYASIFSLVFFGIIAFYVFNY